MTEIFPNSSITDSNNVNCFYLTHHHESEIENGLSINAVQDVGPTGRYLVSKIS